MKIKKSKSAVNPQSEAEPQTVEMVAYFDGHESDHRPFWACFNMEDVKYQTDLCYRFEGDFPEFRKTLYDYIMRISLGSNPEGSFYNSVLSYLCVEKSIHDEISKYPNGGWAIIGHFNYNNRSLERIEFLNPDTFNTHMKNDYSVINLEDNEQGISFLDDGIVFENIAEAVFLSALVELIKNNVYSCCHYTNEELLRFSPIPDRATEWIAVILGKLQDFGIIGVITYKSNGTNWYRDIFLQHHANHIQFVTHRRLSA